MDNRLKDAIQRMKNGEEAGFNEVYSATYNRVYFRAKQIMKKEEDALDLTQIVFVEAYRNIHTLQAEEAIYGWLDGITYNQGMKIYRKQKDVLLTEESEGVFDTLESNDISSIPELSADQRATADIVRQIVEELPELQKSAVVAYYFDGLKVEQIADMMECSANTIKSRLNYARKYMRDRVEEREKTEGYRLHAWGLPVLWYSIKLMADSTTLTQDAAQSVYNGICNNIGLKATAIGTAATQTTGAAGGTAATQTAGVSGSTAAAQTTGMAGSTAAAQTVATAAQAAAATGKAVGIGAKFVALSTTAKTLVVAGAVAVGGAGTAGAVWLVPNIIEMVEEANAGAETDWEDDWEEESEEPESTEKEVEESTEAEQEPTEEMTQEEPNEIELTEAAQKQLSAFVFFCDNDVSSMTDDDILYHVVEYMNLTGSPESTFTPVAADDILPYEWINGIITPEEVRTFARDGLGIEMSEDYPFAIERDWYYMSVASGRLEMEADLMTVIIVGGGAEIVEQDGDDITVSGTYTVIDEEGTRQQYQYTLRCAPSGNEEIFGGLQIKSIESKSFAG